MSMNDGLHLHHLMSKSKWAKRKYPLLIHSLLNLVLLHDKCHLNKVGGLRMSPYNADKREQFLQKHPRITRFLNEVT
jgi:hypothetical protein